MGCRVADLVVRVVVAGVADDAGVGAGVVAPSLECEDRQAPDVRVGVLAGCCREAGQDQWRGGWAEVAVAEDARRVTVDEDVGRCQAAQGLVNLTGADRALAPSGPKLLRQGGRVLRPVLEALGEGW